MYFVFQFECEDEHSGVWLADGGYPCSKLNDENDRLGIYANRDSLCTQKEINCCVTCKPIRKYQLTHYPLVSSAHNICKQIGPRSGPTFSRA